MKRTTIILMFVTLIIILFVAYFYLSKPIARRPERLSNVPKQAEWVGGTDGGIWYQITEVISKNKFRIRFYNEGNGELEVDTTFALNTDCSLKELDSALLVKSINGYDGKEVLLSVPENGKKCSLIIK